MADLKPCPFCGGDRIEIYDLGHQETPCWFVTCNNCGDEISGFGKKVEQSKHGIRGLTMAEYLDREAFKKSVEERYCKPCKAEKKDHNGCWCRACWVDDMLDEVECFQPADVTPVVRCKGCKHYDLGVCLKIYSDGNAHPEAWQSRKPEDFCSYGERKDGDNAT